MIDRYRSPEMRDLWSDRERYHRWFKVEVAALKAMVSLGKIGEDEIPNGIYMDLTRIKEIEAEVKHDFVAFLRYLEEWGITRWVHFGLTSSDVVDTALGLTISYALTLVLNDLEDLHAILRTRATQWKYTPMMGRTHGMEGEPITLGLKVLNWAAQIDRCVDRLVQADLGIRVGKFSGSMGTYAHLDPKVEQIACESLGIHPCPISNQIIQRDRHAEVLTSLAILAGCLERIAVDVRLLQSRGEASEGFGPGQRGSSSMPFKRNPISSENVCGLARLIRGYAAAALENIALWGERDITHSSVERVIFPDSFAVVQHMILRVREIVEGLYLGDNLIPEGEFDDRQEVILTLIKMGASRSEAERSEPDTECINMGFPDHLRHVDLIFNRVLGD